MFCEEIGLIELACEYFIDFAECRAAMKVDMDVAILLDRYFSAKPELVERKRELIEKGTYHSR